MIGLHSGHETVEAMLRIKEGGSTTVGRSVDATFVLIALDTELLGLVNATPATLKLASAAATVCV